MDSSADQIKEELFDKYLNNNLSFEDATQLKHLLQDEGVGREMIEYIVEIHSYLSITNQNFMENK